MSDSTPPPGAAPELDEDASRLVAVVNLLAEMCMHALQQGEAEASRSFVDCIETLQKKTEGNTGDTERQVFEGVLYQLRMAIVQGPPAPEAGPAPEPGN